MIELVRLKATFEQLNEERNELMFRILGYISLYVFCVMDCRRMPIEFENSL